MTSLSVSVALCTYNGAAFIEEQIRSILDQSLPPIELVVSDDGSTDDTLDLIQREFANRPGSPVRLRILGPVTHLGVTANFERAIVATTGELIALCDQDDVWHTDRLAAVVPQFVDDPRLLFLNSDATLVGADGGTRGESLFGSLRFSEWERRLIDADAAFAAYIRRNLATGATTIIRRALVRSATPFPPEWVHDEWLAIIAAGTGRLRYLDEELIDYRQHENNQIGVAAPTFRHRLGRLLEPRGDRYVKLALRSRLLVSRLREIGVEPEIAERAADKARFETVRAGYPLRRLPRLPAVLAEYRRGSYDRLSSQGNLDVLRDILQPR